MARDGKKWEAALRKEFQTVEKREKKLETAARQAKPAQWKLELEQKIPEKVYSGLETAFCKGFALVFEQGRAIIEKTCKKEERQTDYAVRDYAVQMKGGRKELKQMRKGAAKNDLQNMAVTAAEGIGLGILGIGMPDIVLFISTLLKGIYETALNYGFDYESRQEQLLILKMMAAALSTGEDYIRLNADVDDLLEEGIVFIPEDAFESQLQETASVFAMDMLLLKFIQGIPVIGLLGGLANPFYYGKIMRYVGLKYCKRYLMKRRTEHGLSDCNI
ncbi:MAG: EcsC family protein [Oscillospiraceae bacterium]|nr:EcsC family protein [Oscillospiraceae bacterium]